MRQYKKTYKPRFYLPYGERPGDYEWSPINKTKDNKSEICKRN
jgi:hypothetical protein